MIFFFATIFAGETRRIFAAGLPLSMDYAPLSLLS
jgi:hypothetical protein